MRYQSICKTEYAGLVFVGSQVKELDASLKDVASFDRTEGLSLRAFSRGFQSCNMLTAEFYERPV